MVIVGTNKVYFNFSYEKYYNVHYYSASYITPRATFSDYLTYNPYNAIKKQSN